MPEPTTAAAAAMATVTATGAVTMLTAFGIPLGLRPDVLIAGFAGSLSAMALLGLVPATGDTWRSLMQTSIRRMCVALASSATAGYLTPLGLLANASDPVLLGTAFAIGGGAHHVLAKFITSQRGRSGGVSSSGDTERGRP